MLYFPFYLARIIPLISKDASGVHIRALGGPHLSTEGGRLCHRRGLPSAHGRPRRGQQEEPGHDGAASDHSHEEVIFNSTHGRIIGYHRIS